MPKSSAWNEHLQKLAKRRTMMREFEKQSAALASQFNNTFSSQLTATVDNVAKTAQARIIAEAQKRAEQQRTALMQGLDKLA